MHCLPGLRQTQLHAEDTAVPANLSGAGYLPRDAFPRAWRWGRGSFLHFPDFCLSVFHKMKKQNQADDPHQPPWSTCPPMTLNATRPSWSHLPFCWAVPEFSTTSLSEPFLVTFVSRYRSTKCLPHSSLIPSLPIETFVLYFFRPLPWPSPRTLYQ